MLCPSRSRDIPGPPGTAQVWAPGLELAGDHRVWLGLAVGSAFLEFAAAGGMLEEVTLRMPDTPFPQEFYFRNALRPASTTAPCDLAEPATP